MIPIWQHVLTILALLASHAWTFRILYTRNRALQGALNTKRVLVGDEHTVSGRFMLAGDTLLIKSRNHVKLAEISVLSGSCQLDAKIFI